MNGGVKIKKRWDLIFASALVIFLIIAYFIGNSIIKGVLLFLFSAILIINTAMKLKGKHEDKFKDKFFYGILLFLEIVLAISALFVIVTAILGA